MTEAAAFTASDLNFSVYRGFATLRNRILQRRQARLVLLEKQLNDLDKEHAAAGPVGTGDVVVTSGGHTATLPAGFGFVAPTGANRPPVIVNILFFHALMAPSGLPLALFVAVLWAVIFVDVRPAFAGLFQSRLQARA